MQALLAIARLTLKAAFRFRLVPILAVLLLGTVLALPAVIKHDGSARGLTQIVLTYTLGMTTAVLGLSTLWLGCGTLARDIEECQIQMVAVKPISRWQIWLGKWLGIMLLNGLLLGLAAGIVFIQMNWKARSLDPAQQEVLRNEVFVARGSFHEPPPNIEPDVERILQQRLKNEAVSAMNRDEVRKIIREQIKAQIQAVPSGYSRSWEIHLGAAKDSLHGQPLFLRIKFFAADKSPSGTYTGLWEVGVPGTPKRWRNALSQAAETFYEFPIPPDLFDESGKLTITFANQNETTILFPLEDGMEVLYREGGFGLNYLRGVAIVFCWLALLAALGLAAASFLSFPVAAFLAFGVLVLAFSTSTMSQVIEQGTIREVNHETGVVGEQNVFDKATVTLFRGTLTLINLVKDFSPIDLLSSGRSVTWGQVGLAFAQIVVLMGGIFAAIGISIFARRELATAQGKT